MIYTRSFPITSTFKISQYNPAGHVLELKKKATSVGPEQNDPDECTLDEAMDLKEDFETIVRKTYEGLKKNVTQGEDLDGLPCPEDLTLTEFNVDGAYVEPSTMSEGGFLYAQGLGLASLYGQALPTIAEATAGMTEPIFLPLGQHIAIYDRYSEGYDIPPPEEDEGDRGIGDYYHAIKYVASCGYNGSVYLAEPLTVWGESHWKGWNPCQPVTVFAPFLFLVGSHYHETCEGGWLYRYPVDVVRYFGDRQSGEVGHIYKTSMLEYATDVWYSTRSALATGEHTIEMCQAAGADGCNANIWNRVEQFVLREDYSNQFFKRRWDQWAIYFHVPIIDCSRRIKLVNGNPSIVPALIGAGLLAGLTTLGMITATLGSTAGAGRRVPRRNT